MVERSESQIAEEFSSDERFIEYYADKTQTEEMRLRMSGICGAILRVLRRYRDTEDLGTLDVLDIGCNAGVLCTLWAELQHRVSGLDINAPLLDIAKQRASETGYEIDYRLGSATELPWDDESKDVYVALELLEHVEDWQSCLNEAVRVLRPGGLLLVTTTNVLCPKQDEFNLPFFCWYPGFVKRHFVRLAQTTRPELANYAKYPAVNWFSYFGLRAFLKRLGMSCCDRFDAMDLDGKSFLFRTAARAVRGVLPLRIVAHMLAKGSIVYAYKPRKT